MDWARFMGVIVVVRREQTKHRAKSREASNLDETDAKDTTRFPGLFGTCMSMETATMHMLVAERKDSWAY